ncbi:hypothetical protein ACWDKQ_16720 [Saccharopolyspora sp. NPDC000995]
MTPSLAPGPVECTPPARGNTNLLFSAEADQNLLHVNETERSLHMSSTVNNPSQLVTLATNPDE